MTTFAPPLDTGGGAIFSVYGSELRGGEREERGGQLIGNAGREPELAEHVFYTSAV